MISVSLLSHAQISAVYQLEQLCFPEDPWSVSMFEQELNNPLSVFLVATDDATCEVVGYGGVWLMHDVGNITNIAVHPELRREKIGTRLLQLLIQICKEKNMQSITLEVRSGNIPAQAMYERMGFSVCGIRKRYYQNREDALIMTKELSEQEEK